jgi:hypothetical protein
VSYCPYSKFRVGCAILTNNGEYIIGLTIPESTHLQELMSKTPRTVCLINSFKLLIFRRRHMRGAYCNRQGGGQSSPVSSADVETEGHTKFQAIGVAT